ncbi:MAG: chemotaxis protein CheW [Acidobacteriota bacterium]|nr:chemotaxis protein CheW [Acidobacteriota bacterium]
MDDQSRKLQFLRAGSLELGIFTDEIAAIAEWREPTPLPHAPKSVLGVVSIQGRMLTVIDLAVLSNIETGPEDGSDVLPRHIISLRGDEQLALAVAAIGETSLVSESDLSQPMATEERFVLSVLRHGDVEVKVLNVKELFPVALQGRERRQRQF